MACETELNSLQDLTEFINKNYSTLHNSRLCNGHVIHRCLPKAKPTPLSTAASLLQLMEENPDHHLGVSQNLKSLRITIDRLSKQFYDLRRHLKRNTENIINLLDTPFQFPKIKSGLSSQLPETPDPVDSHISSNDAKMPGTDRGRTYVPKRKCSMRCQNLRDNLVNNINKLKKKVLCLRSENKVVRRFYSSTSFDRNIKRNTKAILRYRASLRKKNSQIRQLYIDIATLEKEKTLLTRQSKSESKKLTSTICQLEEQLALFEITDDVTDTQNKNVFTVPVRKAIYKCLCSNLSVKLTGDVIGYITSIFGVCLDRLPCSATIAAMCYEMSVLSNIQVAEALLEGSGSTLAWDATTKKGLHINEIHFSTSSTVLTASLKQLPGGLATDYVGHIVDTIDEVAESYAEMNETTVEEIRRRLFGSILCTLTDRASVNHAAVVLLEERLGRELVELNCHLHPLDGIARDVCSELRKTNVDIDSTNFGKDCRAANLLHSISKLRYKATGDPSGFMSYLKKNHLSCNVFPRFVGNRLHVLFHSSGIVFKHRELLITYLDKFCNNRTTLMSATLGDLRHPVIVAHLRALGLWGKVVTGPWMALFYAEENNKNHLEMVSYLRCCVSTVHKIASTPGLIFTMAEDAFGRQLVVDDVLNALRADNDDSALSVVTSIANATAAVLERQLRNYFTGPLSNPSQSTLDSASSAPLHNIWAERTLGALDAQINRAPNATITFLDSKVKMKVNHTLHWLDQKPVAIQKDIIMYSIKKRAALRQKGKERRREVDHEIRQRLMKKSQQRDMRNRNKIAKDAERICSDIDSHINDTMLQGLAPDQQEKVISLLQKDDCVIGDRVQHVWNVDNVDTIYYGKILKLCTRKSNKKPGIWITYWTVSVGEAESIDYRINTVDILVDMVLGDFIFM